MTALDGKVVVVTGSTRGTGLVHNLLRGRRTMRGAAPMAWWGMTGRMRRG